MSEKERERNKEKGVAEFIHNGSQRLDEFTSYILPADHLPSHGDLFPSAGRTPRRALIRKRIVSGAPGAGGHLTQAQSAPDAGGVVAANFPADLDGAGPGFGFGGEAGEQLLRGVSVAVERHVAQFPVDGRLLFVEDPCRFRLAAQRFPGLDVDEDRDVLQRDSPLHGGDESRVEGVIEDDGYLLGFDLPGRCKYNRCVSG